ncbi:hypothetical protein CLOM_g13716 [Closterium sp. NIES-68]|nr:hypothetical protein CLOM_g3784 [Closterium sp. NIES-68]GJP54655.1 hypothetical protein CLOM_g13716 [Closterium sp. NIES-68]GJP73506.1 hypothetical protein CLOP_g4210 [Closterium sp. NIES-67]
MGLCYLYTAGLCSSDNSAEIKRTVYTPKDPISYVGGRCNGDAPMKEKHTPAISSSLQVSLPERSFCLFSDPELHINMRLGGYLDRRTTLTNPANQPTPRVWIRELGFVWRSPTEGDATSGKSGKEGPVHNMRFVARRGPQEARGEGYLAALEVDGTLVPRLMLGDELSLFDGQATVTLDAHEKSGPGGADVDKYKIRIEGLLEAEVRVRAAHPLLQRDGDAMVHLNLELEQVHYSMDVHGVLGQTYRDEAMEEGSNLDYSVISALLHETARAEETAESQAVVSIPEQQKGISETQQTEGFSSVWSGKLQGSPRDYQVSDILRADCKFAVFGKEQPAPEVPEEQFLDSDHADVDGEDDGINGGDREADLERLGGILRTAA